MKIIPRRQEYGEPTYNLPYILLHQRLHFPTVKIHKENYELSNIWELSPYFEEIVSSNCRIHQMNPHKNRKTRETYIIIIGNLQQESNVVRSTKFCGYHSIRR